MKTKNGNGKNGNENISDFGKTKCKFLHFTLEKRELLEALLSTNSDLKTIATMLNMSESSISREVKRNRVTVENKKKSNKCIYVKECIIKKLCSNTNCFTLCKNCFYGRNCSSICENYDEMKCKKLDRFPYVCNGCNQKKSCTFNFVKYVATTADKRAKLIGSECRRGINLIEDEFAILDTTLVKATNKGQSVEHMCQYGDFSVGPRTIRNYIKNGYTTTSQIETPRGIYFKKRKENISKTDLNKIKSCKVGRDYATFLRYMIEHPFTIYTELDTVEGTKIDGKKPLLMTLIIVRFNLFLCFLIPDGTSIRKKGVFDYLDDKLGVDYEKFFKVILTDNGSEFYSPEDIEINFETGEIRSKVFYCDPYSSWEKGAIEVCHELLRRIIPKGKSLKDLTDLDIVLINNSINNYTRPDLGNKSAYQLFCETIQDGENILKKLKIRFLEPDLVELTPALLNNQTLKERMIKY